MRNVGLDELQTGIKIGIYAGDITLIAESEEELKSLLIRVMEESERTSLKLNIKNKQTNKQRSWHLTPLPTGKLKGETWK